MIRKYFVEDFNHPVKEKFGVCVRACVCVCVYTHVPLFVHVSNYRIMELEGSHKAIESNP